MTSVGISEVFRCFTKVRQSKTKTKKCLLRRLDVSGNKTDIGILSALRSLLGHSKTLKFLCISGLHKFNDEGQKTVMTALKYNQHLQTLDLRFTTEEFYYKLREKMNYREVKGEVVPVKICFKDFVKYQKSAEKSDTIDDENINSTNFHDRIQDYSARVRLFNKEKVMRAKKWSDSRTSPSRPEQSSPSNPDIRIKQYDSIEEESEVSSLTDNVVTCYRKSKVQAEASLDPSNMTLGYAGQGLSQISLTSLESQEEEKDGSSSSDSFGFESNSLHVSKMVPYDSKSTYSVGTDWSKPIDLKSTERSLDSQGDQNQTQELVTNYKKLLNDIRNVISDQRSSITKKINAESFASKPHNSI